MGINATLIGQMITFALLVWFTMKYIWPPLFESLEERKKKIAAGLAAAEKGQQDLLLAEKRAMAVIKEAKEQSSEIVGLAHKRAAELVEESKDQAKKESERILVAARAQVDQEMLQAREKLREEVATLALAIAERVLGAEIDQSRHYDILNNVSNQLSR